MPDETARPPRFPYIAALLCAACLGAAGWTWMRYSYAWDMTPGDFWKDARRLAPDERDEYLIGEIHEREKSLWHEHYLDHSLLGKYVEARGVFCHRNEHSRGLDALVDRTDPYAYVLVRGLATRDLPVEGADFSAAGRATQERQTNVVVDTTASRLTGASIAGLAVGAMGVFVFGAALRHWLNQRRRFGDPEPGR